MMIPREIQVQLNKALIARNNARDVNTQNEILRLYKIAVKKITAILESYFKTIKFDEVHVLIKNQSSKREINEVINELYAKIENILTINFKDIVNDNYTSILGLNNRNDMINDVLMFSLLYSSALRQPFTSALKINKDKLVKDIFNAMNEINENSFNSNRISDIIFYRKSNSIRGDAAKTLRILRTESTKLRTLSKIEAINLLTKDGINVIKEWLYTYESKEPRLHHLSSDGQRADSTGYFYIAGMKTLGPGLFGIASEDINCKCDTRIFVTDQ